MYVRFANSSFSAQITFANLAVGVYVSECGQPQAGDARCSAALCCRELGGSHQHTPCHSLCRLEGNSL